VADVNVAVKGLTVSIDRSKHWILNKVIVQPLLAPLGRWIVSKMLEAQVRTALEAVERVIGDIVFETRKIRTARAEGDESSSRHGLDSAFTDYWDTLLRVFSRGASEESSEAVSNITVGMKGIVRTTTTQPSNGAIQPSETVLAIAEGAQLFPGKAGPYCEDDGEEVGSDVGEAVMGVVSKTRSIVGGIAGGVVSGREDLGSAQTMGKLREREERQRHGWRSQVFDL
jgi:hypothetical protein